MAWRFDEELNDTRTTVTSEPGLTRSIMKRLSMKSATLISLAAIVLWSAGCGSTEPEAEIVAQDAEPASDVDVPSELPLDAESPEITVSDTSDDDVSPEDVSGDAGPPSDSGEPIDSVEPTDSLEPFDDAKTEIVEDVAFNPWPVNPNKDSIPDPGWDSAPAVGTVLPNFTAVDQYGNTVELYDLAMEGKPIVLEIGAWVCEPCKALSWFLSTGETGECPHSEVTLDTINWWSRSFELIKELVDEGSIRWVTILFSLDDPMTTEDSAAWHEIFTHDEIVVLADEQLQIQEYLQVAAMPRIEVLDEEMVFLVYGAEYNPDAPLHGGPQK